MVNIERGSRQLYLLDNIRYKLNRTAKKLWKARDRFEDDTFNHVPIRDDEIEAIKPLINQGYEYIGFGNSRIVLKLPDNLNQFVVKIGRFGNNPLSIGMWQNNNEVTLWSKLNNKDYPLLPVYDWQKSNCRWLVMPYGKDLESMNISEQKTDKLVSQASEKLQELDQLSKDEFESQNFVFYDNQLFLADYGRKR